jgi:hypothetical protein
MKYIRLRNSSIIGTASDFRDRPTRDVPITCEATSAAQGTKLAILGPEIRGYWMTGPLAAHERRWQLQVQTHKVFARRASRAIGIRIAGEIGCNFPLYSLTMRQAYHGETLSLHRWVLLRADDGSTSRSRALYVAVATFALCYRINSYIVGDRGVECIRSTGSRGTLDIRESQRQRVLALASAVQSHREEQTIR